MKNCLIEVGTRNCCADEAETSEITGEQQSDTIPMDRLDNAIQRLKLGKLIKYSEEKGKEQLLNKANTTREVPIDWQMGMISPIFKKETMQTAKAIGALHC